MAIIAAMAGVFLGGGAKADIGPFKASISLEPSVSGESEVALPPLGSLIFDSHEGPLRMSVRMDSLDQSRTEEFLANPEGLREATETVPGDVLAAVTNVALSAVGASVLAGLVLGGLVFRNMRRAAWCGTLSLVVAAASMGLAASTVRPESVNEPRFEGVLANAPAVVGSAQTIADNYQQYRNQLQQFILNMSEFYTIAHTLPSFDPAPGTIRALHVSDLHLNPGSWDVIESVVRQFQIDLVLDTGDITDWGSERESELYLSGITRATVPYVYVRGNHDSMQTQEIVAEQPNGIVLDDEVIEVGGLTIGGIGDPRFTPDKSSQPWDDREEQVLYEAGAQLRDTIGDTVDEAENEEDEDAEDEDVSADDFGVDVAMVHDPRMSYPLAGETPLVLAGHRHQRQVELISDDTMLMVEGSTGGAGLRGLQRETPTPLELSVLYFEGDDQVLQAVDNISVGGHGETEVTLQRHVLADGLPAEGSELLPEPDEEDPEATREPDND